MILVTLVLMTPGNHEAVAHRAMNAVPRKDDLVLIGDRVHSVHSVIWDLAKNDVTVMLNP